MRRALFTLFTLSWMTAMSVSAQTYQALWKLVDEAQEKDLPKTAMTHLQKIERKATKEQAYGQLLKSTLLYAKLQAEVAPDSLAPAVKRLEQREQAAKDVALKAVYDVVLSKLYNDNHELGDNWQARRDDYRQQAMSHPEVLAKTKVDGYVPFVVKEQDSELYGHDLLSIVGMELDEWAWLNRYYDQAGNRQAACLTALHTVNTIAGIDSLINVYGDLPVAGELAISRYELMTAKNYSAAEKNSWIEQALQRWGTWKRMNQLRNEQTALNNPSYQVRIEQSVQEVGKAQTVQLTELRNVQRLTMHVYRTTLAGDTKLSLSRKEDLEQIRKQSTPLQEYSKTLTFTGHESYDVFKDSLQLDGLPAGVYVLMFKTEPKTRVTRMLYFVSGIRVISQALPHNEIRYVVVDATTGQPVKGAQLQLTFRKGVNNSVEYKTLTCDDQGEAIYNAENQRPNSVYAYTAADKYCPEQSGYGNYSYYERPYNNEHVNLFTDRSIYRPGQTVQVTAIAWKELSATENAAVEGKQFTLTLRDANYKVVGEQQATTDRFGKCSALFTLPTGLLNGRFTVQTRGGSIGFQVEDYKRPTFQVEFADYQESYRNGDTIQVQGKAVTYAGVPVQNAKVKYTVKRRVAYWWMNYSHYWQGGYIGRGLQDEVLSEGEATTGDDGTFKVDMPMVLPADLGRHTMFYHFVVDADVTDMGGETHHGTLSLPLGNKATALTCDLPEQVRRDQLPQVTFNRRNAAGHEIPGTVRYRLDGSKKWSECAANSQQSIVNSQLKSGEHQLEAICEGDTISRKFVVFALDDKQPATQTKDWWYVSDTQFPNNGKPVILQVGSSAPDLHIVYSIFAGDKVIESGVEKRNSALVNRKLTYKKEYDNGLLVTYAWVKDGQCYRHQQFIRRPMPDKQLKLSWETFRDRLTPGLQEEWRLKVITPNGKPADASLMAVLYDKSLDAIKQHQWTFVPATYVPHPSTSWQWRNWGSKGLSGALTYKALDVPYLTFSTFDSSLFPVYLHPMFFRGQRNIMIRGSQMMAKTGVVAEAAPAAIGAFDVKGNDNAAGELLMAKETADTEESVIVGYGSDNNEASQQEEVQVRENLQETAFCYPALSTDANGVAVLKFTLPESLTTWRFMGIANTADMLYGSIAGEAIAQKDVMIQPNVPRFIRQGDEAQVSARIFNTTDHAVSGTAKLQLIDPETEQVVQEQTAPFSVAGGKTTSATFQIQPSVANTSLLICKVTAAGEGFSDGEQHYLPILPNSEYVTKTIPYTQHEPGVKTIDLTKLFPQGTTQQKLTVEYTNNPAWLMVQSLPTLGQPCEHSAIDQAASYYSNLLAKSLLAQSPQVKSVFGQWQQELADAASSHSTTLHAQLEKDQELKDLILEETPWVAAADREREQKQRLADFFDENLIDNRLSTAIEKLQALQHADGSFSWYPGMDGNASITVAVVEMLARLQVMTKQSSAVLSSTASPSTPAVTALYDKAFEYIGQEMTDLVVKMKKDEKKGIKPSFPSFTALRWLYICAIDGRSLSAKVKSANTYLIGLLKKDIKNQTIYGKALTAVVLAQRGEKTKAAEYVKSLKEYTVYTEEMGRYYDTRRATYSWYDYKIPTEVAAIEAIQRVTPDDGQTVDEMRRWLLQEKRAQAWDTPINSANAIYAFLSGHGTALTTNSPATVLAIDGSPIDTKATTGIGYVKTVVDAPSMNTVADGSAVSTPRLFTATKTSEGTSWGAVYAQFLQQTSAIEASESGITIQREVMPLTSSPSSLTSHPSPLTSLSVGDRIKVRITINSTRDLDFVQVVDRRAACMEPVNQLSGYRNGAYMSPKDNATHYFFGMLSKGRHVIETEYYIDRAGQYETGTCTVGCAYAPEYRATAPSVILKVTE